MVSSLALAVCCLVSLCLGLATHLLSMIEWGPLHAGHLGLFLFMQSLLWWFPEQWPHLAGLVHLN